MSVGVRVGGCCGGVWCLWWSYGGVCGMVLGVAGCTGWLRLGGLGCFAVTALCCHTGVGCALQLRGGGGNFFGGGFRVSGPWPV